MFPGSETESASPVSPVPSDPVVGEACSLACLFLAISSSPSRAAFWISGLLCPSACKACCISGDTPFSHSCSHCCISGDTAASVVLQSRPPESATATPPVAVSPTQLVPWLPSVPSCAVQALSDDCGPWIGTAPPVPLVEVSVLPASPAGGLLSALAGGLGLCAEVSFAAPRPPC
jgi:hypothetical protein